MVKKVSKDRYAAKKKPKTKQKTKNNNNKEQTKTKRHTSVFLIAELNIEYLSPEVFKEKQETVAYGSN